jgi:DNA-directed RNA polymerase subunit L
MKDIKYPIRYLPNKLYTKLNEELLIFKNWYSIDVLWVFKGVEIFRDTLLKIKSYNVLLVNYNPDHPFIRTFASSGGRKIVKAIPLYDSHFSYSNNVIERINDDFKCDVLKLPFAFEDTCINWANITSQKEIIKICFVGNPDKFRVSLIRKIISWNFSIDIYGFGWEKFFRNNKFVNCLGVADTHELYSILRKYRIQLNIFRPHNINAHNMRSFEICGVGGVQLAQYSEDHLFYFEENLEIYLFRSDNELKDKLNYLLTASDELINNLRTKAREKSIINHYTYENRAKLVSDYLLRKLLMSL